MRGTMRHVPHLPQDTGQHHGTLYYMYTGRKYTMRKYTIP